MKTDYAEYLQSSAWRRRRACRLALAGGRCEFRPLHLGPYGQYEWQGQRCTATRELEVHHLHYESLGHESDAELEVLCLKHHLVRHLQKFECDRCGEHIVGHECDAVYLVEGAFAAIDPSPDKMTLDTVLAYRSWVTDDNTGRLCDYCAHVLNKDD